MSPEKKEFKKVLKLEQQRRHKKLKNVDVILKVSDHGFKVLAR